MTIPLAARTMPVAATLLLATACSPATDRGSARGAGRADSAAVQGDRGSTELPAALADGIHRIDARVDSLDALLKPVALLRPDEEAALRRYLSAEHTRSARRLGVTPGRSSRELDSLAVSGELARLPDSTGLFVVRRLDHSLPLLTPRAAALLGEIATRFQARLGTMGLPPLRLEVTSALRSEADQSALRGSNPNAARGTSAHEYGTTFDIAYSAFAAPARPVVAVEARDGPEVARFLDRYAAVAADALGGRRSYELEAILGRLLRTMQDEGKVMVTRETLEPVFHLTVR